MKKKEKEKIGQQILFSTMNTINIITYAISALEVGSQSYEQIWPQWLIFSAGSRLQLWLCYSVHSLESLDK